MKVKREKAIKKLEDAGIDRMKIIKMWAKQKWTVGQYTPSDEFKKISNHSCVCKPDKELISLSGPADDIESQMLSDLFAAAPEMLIALETCLIELSQYDMANEPGGSMEIARIDAMNKARSAIRKATGHE